MTWIAMSIGVAFALNIGASGTAAAMGAAYGGKAVTRRKAQWLAGLFALLGSVVGGGAVVVRIGNGIVPEGMITVTGAIVILASACMTLALANYMRIPLSTSEVTVGAVVGLGLAIRDAFRPHRPFHRQRLDRLPAPCRGAELALRPLHPQPVESLVSTLKSPSLGSSSARIRTRRRRVL